MTALWIILIITASLAILFALHIKVKLLFSTGGENTIDLQYAFLKFRILPKAAEEDIEEAAEESAGEAPQKPKKKRNVSSYLRLLKAAYKDLKDGLFGLLNYVVKHAVTIYELNISADYGFSDPMTTGMATGAANAAVYNIIGLLQRNMKLKSWSVNLNPDFDENKLNAGIYCILGTNIFHIIALGGIVIKTAVKVLYKARKLKK